MAKGYQQLWKDVTNATDEAKAVRTLAGILANKEGRTFISRLGRKDGELCIEILDRVGCDLRLLSFVLLDDLCRVSQGTTSKPPRNKLSSPR